MSDNYMPGSMYGAGLDGDAGTEVECPVCGDFVPDDEYSFTDGMCWECREDEDTDEE
jgi:hypothetical protein